MAAVRELRTAALQAGALMALGDIIAQQVVDRQKEIKPQPHDWARTARFAAVGTFLGGPSLRIWYGTLNKLFGSTGKAATVKKVIADQTLFAPTFISALLTSLSLLEGKNFDYIKEDLSKNYLDILKTNYYIWPWVQLTNFYFVPLKFQVLTVQTVAIMWNTYLSWKTQK